MVNNFPSKLYDLNDFVFKKKKNNYKKKEKLLLFFKNNSPKQKFSRFQYVKELSLQIPGQARNDVVGRLFTSSCTPSTSFCTPSTSSRT